MTHDGRALAAAERSLAGLRYRVAERALGAWRSRVRYQPAPPRLDWATGQHAETVENALSAGALESLGDPLERLCAQLPQLPPSTQGGACRTAVDALLMLGERARASALAQTHRGALAATAEGAGRLECLGLACDLRSADGRWNLLGISLRLREQRLSVEALARELGSSWTQLTTPELALLFFSELWPREPERALGYLTHFTRAHGLRQRLQLHGERPGSDLLTHLRGQGGARARGPLVSVVVAAYNAGTTLSYALDSLLAQTHGALEILVADDASTDDTAEVMKRYAGEPRLRLFRSEGNQGAYNVRNQLAAQARGAFLTFHDADDWALPARISAQLAALRQTRAQGSIANLLRVEPTGQVRFFKNQRAARLSRVSLLLRRETFMALGGFRSARVGADYELAEKLGSLWGERAFVRSKAPLMLSRAAAGSATASPGTESDPDGYCAPARRAYCQLVFDRYRAGRDVSDELVEQRLRETSNWQAPTGLRPL